MVIANEAALKLVNNDVNVAEIHEKSLFDLVTMHPDYKEIALKRREKLLGKNSKAKFMEQKVIVNGSEGTIEIIE